MLENETGVALVETANNFWGKIEEIFPWLTPEVLHEMTTSIMGYFPKLIGALLVVIIGFWITAKIGRLVEKAFERTDFDPAVERFLESLLGFLLKIIVVLAALSMIGIPMASFLAILGAAGLAVGLALQGSLSNFAGGVLILIFKPFKIGDFIEASGHSGTVEAISVVATTLLTGDNKTIIIPNGGLSNNSVINFSTQNKRRVEWNIGIDYGDDIDKARKVLSSIIKEDKRIILKDGTLIAVSELADSAVVIKVRVWVKTSDYWAVFFENLEVIKKRFDKEGLNFPYPQLVTHKH